MELATERVRLRVPATAGNLGPGFDALGLAFGLYDEVEVRVTAKEPKPGSSAVAVFVSGEGAGEVPTDESNLVVRAFRYALDAVGAPQPAIEMTCRNAIPHGRGLGSSAAAVVAGIAAARALLADPDALSDRDVLALATAFEGHPDNAAPAIYGGATVAWEAPEDRPEGGVDGAAGRPQAARLDVLDQIRPTLLVPPEALLTEVARAALPIQVPHRDAAYNAGRSALLVHALAAAPELLFDATTDRLHQDYRASAMPRSWELMQALRRMGFAAVISGAGPSVLVLASGDELARLDAALPELTPEAGWAVLRPGIARRGVETLVCV